MNHEVMSMDEQRHDWDFSGFANLEERVCWMAVLIAVVMGGLLVWFLMDMPLPF